MSKAHSLTISQQDLKPIFPPKNQEDFLNHIEEEVHAIYQVPSARQAQEQGLISRAVSLRYAQVILKALREQILPDFSHFVEYANYERGFFVELLTEEFVTSTYDYTKKPLPVQNDSELLNYYYQNYLQGQESSFVYLTALGHYLMFRGITPFAYWVQHAKEDEGYTFVQRHGVWYLKNHDYGAD